MHITGVGGGGENGLFGERRAALVTRGIAVVAGGKEQQ